VIACGADDSRAAASRALPEARRRSTISSHFSVIAVRSGGPFADCV
jgi:hypothetical protein